MTDLARADRCARFDIPSVIASCDVTTSEFMAAHPHERLIQLVIPCSALVECKKPKSVSQLMVQVRGLSPGLQIVDYSPRTQTYTEVDGTVSVETHRERSSSLGLDAKGTVSESVHLGGTAQTGGSSGTTLRYQRRPEQKLLLASGTINRGAGVYYKFLHSGQATLEGAHELIITWRVPAGWRGGLVRVDCRASGVEKYLIGSDDDFVAGRQTFVVATYLKGDLEAQQLAQQYSRIERTILQYASDWKRAQEKRDHNPLAQLNQLFGSRDSKLPPGWTEQLMLYDTHSIQTKFRPYLSKSMQRATDQFVAVRRQLLGLNR